MREYCYNYIGYLTSYYIIHKNIVLKEVYSLAGVLEDY